MKYRYKLVLGDWSCDGHNIMEYITISTDTNIQDIRNAYLKYVKKYKISLTEENLNKGCTVILSEYEENLIDDDTANILQESGINIKSKFAGEDDYCFDADTTAWLFFEMVGVMLPNFEYKIEGEDLETINTDGSPIGGIGYGVFHV